MDADVLFRARLLASRFGLAAIAIAFATFFIVDKVREDSTVFAIVGLNGLTLAALLFLAASGFTLVFGLMRVTNLAHGAFYLFGGYLGYELVGGKGGWLAAVAGAALAIAATGLLMQQLLLRRVEGDDMREALVTLGVAIVIADQLLARWGGNPVDISVPERLAGALELPVGGIVYPTYRLTVLAIACGTGAGLWILLKKTRLGMAIRAGVDDRPMLAALGVPVPLLLAATFALGSAMAGASGVIGGSFLGLAPGEDGRILLYSLVVVVVGGLGSVGGVALGALLVGVVNQYAALYAPSYAALITFGMMIVALTARPEGLLGRAG